MAKALDATRACRRVILGCRKRRGEPSTFEPGAGHHGAVVFALSPTAWKRRDGRRLLSRIDSQSANPCQDKPVRPQRARFIVVLSTRSDQGAGKPGAATDARHHLRAGAHQQQRGGALAADVGCQAGPVFLPALARRWPGLGGPSASSGRRPQARPCVVPVAGSASERTKAIAGPRRRGLDDKFHGPIDHLRHRAGAPSAHQSSAIARSCRSGTILVSCRRTGHAEKSARWSVFPGRALMTRCGAPTSEE